MINVDPWYMLRDQTYRALTEKVANGDEEVGGLLPQGRDVGNKMKPLPGSLRSLGC